MFVFSCELNKNAQGHSGEHQLPGMPLFVPLGLAGMGNSKKQTPNK